MIQQRVFAPKVRGPLPSVRKTAYLRNLYDCPLVGYYELLPPPFWSSDFALRKEFRRPRRSG
jgi:hypothetical protein